MVQYDLETFIRAALPGFRNIGPAPVMEDTTSLKHIKEHKYEIARTKGELIREYGGWMKKVQFHTMVGVASFGASLFFIWDVMNGAGGTTSVALATALVSYGMYKWWKGGATYSNWQQYEMRPVLMPTEDITMWEAGAGGH